MDAMWVVGVFWSRSKPEIVIKLGRHGLRNEVGPAATQSLFPMKSCRTTDGNFERPVQDSGLHQFPDRCHGNSHPVSSAFKPEPGVEPATPSVSRERSPRRLTLAAGPAY